MENPLKGKYDVGVVVGRFQVPGLTDGHKHLLDNVNDAHKQLIIAVGVSPTLGTKRNPLGYTPRMQMLREIYPKAIIVPIMDGVSDEAWSKQLDTLIRSVCPIGSVCLYGGRDSFIKHYTGKYSTFELGANDGEATKVRESIGKEVINSYEFRAGAIHQSQNQYSKVFPCVDIAVVKKEDGARYVLMALKPGESKWRFPGGFVDPTDTCLEDAALRELGEELGVSVHPETIEYVTSNIVNDWRYTTPDEKIMTTLYSVEYLSGGGIGEDEELVETDWILLDESELGDEENESSIAENHMPLFKALCQKYKNKKR